MYRFHYDYMKQRFPGKTSQLLFTDTNSLCYEIQNTNMYEVFLNDKDLFDFSNYQKSHTCYDPANKRVIGKFKDELGGYPLREFSGLKAKMYSM